MIKYNEPLSRHTSFKIGGPAFCWLEPEDSKGILEAIGLAGKNNKAISVLGGGTNVLAGDKGFDGIAVHLGKGFGEIKEEPGCVLRVGSAVPTAKLVNYASKSGLSGCEFLTGIPGTIGGAIFMNAGVRGVEDTDKFLEIKDIILDIEALDLDSGKKELINRKEIGFTYRASNLVNKIILGARFQLAKGEKTGIAGRVRQFNKKREWFKKIGPMTAGSVFKNPLPDKSAGMLIESCGLKARRIGNAEISEYHANIIVNKGGARAEDVLGLIELARRSVKDKFGIELELELKII